MNNITVTREIPVVGSYDVVVCGGGPAGWTAAVAAARDGARTALIERFGFLGGACTAGYVIPISGFFKNGDRKVGGIAWEYIERLSAAGGAQVEYPRGHVSVDIEYCKLAIERMVTEAGVDIYSNSCIAGAAREGGRISSVYFVNKNGIEAVTGKCFIDATGDGDLCAAAGIPFTVNETPQPLSYCFELTGVDVTTPLMRDCIHHNGKVPASQNQVLHDFLAEKHKAGEAPLFGGPWFNTELNGDRLAVNVTRDPASVLDNRAYGAAERKMREDIFRIVELWRENFPEFKNAVVSSTAANAGVREGRHIVGIYRLTGDDVLNAVEFPDTVALTTHVVDIHRTDGGEQRLIKFDKAGHIPYRSMITDACDNFIAAGRMVCADEIAHATLRVQACAMAIGEAAGCAAALCAAGGTPVRELGAAALRAELVRHGAVLE